MFGKVSIFCLAIGSLLQTLTAQAGTIIWNGASGTDTNWSDAANWIGGVVPGTSDDVKFYDMGAVTFPTTNNVVDSNVTIGSLQFGNTNNAHTTLIANGMTLTLTNTGGLIAATPNDPVVAKLITNTIAGGQGTLLVTNASAVISVCQGGATGSSEAILNMSKLSQFVANVNRIGVGTSTSFNPGNSNNKLGGVLYLAQTNIITLNLTDTLGDYQTNSSRTNAIEVARNPSNNGAEPAVLYLGQTNIIYLDSIDLGMGKENGSTCWGWMGFNPSFANSVAVFRGVGGSTSRVTWWSIGDGTSVGSSSNGGVGTNDFSNGTVDALINVLSLGRDASVVDTWGGPHRGTLTFNSGTIDANTVIIGNQSLETGASTTPCLGLINVGAQATLRANTGITLGYTTLATTASANTSGNLKVLGGTVYANAIAVGTSSGANSILLSNAVMIVSNTVATNAISLNLAATNSLIGLSVPADGSLRCLTKALTTGGVTNLIQLDPAPVLFATYPQKFPLIKYTIWSGTNNFGLTNTPAWAMGATLVSNAVNSSLDLSLPADPRPVFTAQPTAYSGTPGDNVTTNFVVTIAAASVTPLRYQWCYLTNGVTNLLTDGVGPSGSSTLIGTTTNILVIGNAQTNDSGNYFVVVTNAYGINTSLQALLTISSTAIPPRVSGPAAVTTTNGLVTAISDTVSGSPVPVLYWEYNGNILTNGSGPSGSSIISGASSSPASGASSPTLSIGNPQYPNPSDQGTYTLIASNSAGLATNSTALTILVPPSITQQPLNQVVTNTQGAFLSVTATGVPSPTYQWYKNSLANPISSAINPSATNAIFTIASTSPSDIATYFVIVSNGAGSLTSSNASLFVNSTMSYASLTPANAATGICYDTPLFINFNVAPTVNAFGKIRIYNVTNPVTPVDIIDLGQNVTNEVPYAVNVQPYTIGGTLFTNFPVLINGTLAEIYPHQGLLTSNQTYYVTLDDGTFTDPNGAYFAGITATNAWHFTTKLTGPANRTNLVLAADNSGDFVTLEGAVNAIASGNTTPTIITIKNGTYQELVNINARNNLDLRGQSRGGVIIGYPNNNNVFGGAPQRASFVVNANDCTLENLTITNMTPSGGGQAEALDVEGTRAIFLNMELDSFQDTFLSHSSGKVIYYDSCLIRGQTDFNWGLGTIYYTNCEIRCVLPGGHVTQPRSPATTNGFGFIHCRITAGFPSGNFDLGRTIGTPTSPSEVLFYQCLICTNVTGYSSDAGTEMDDFSCSNLTATAPVSFPTVPPGNDPFVTAIQQASTWLYGWQPLDSPLIISQPQGVSVTNGQTATFTAQGTGIPAPGYQWLLNGATISGATNANYSIAKAVRANGGNYSVVVNNGSGTVTSSAALLTYIDTAPVTTTVSFTRNAVVHQFNINIANLLTNVFDVDGDTITLVSAGLSTNGVTPLINGSYIGYTNANPVADQFNYKVSDGFGGASTGLVIINVDTNSIFGQTSPAITVINGDPTLNFAGLQGYCYSVEVSTNLSSWNVIWTTNAPAGGLFQFTDPAPAQPDAFYRLQYNP